MPSEPRNACPLCSSSAVRKQAGPLLDVTCERCGRYFLTSVAFESLDSEALRAELALLVADARAASEGPLLIGIAVVEHARRRLELRRRGESCTLLISAAPG